MEETRTFGYSPGEFHRIVEEFERAWRDGDEPSIEQFLDSSTEKSIRSELLKALLEIELSFLDSHGKSASRDSYLERFPNDTQIVNEVLTVRNSGVNAKGLSDSSGSLDSMTVGAPTGIAHYSDQLSKFELVERVGAGAFGTVWKAKDKELNRIVALKIPRFGQDEGSENMLHEAKASAGLNHPNIVSVFDVGSENGQAFIVSEFIDGETLADKLEREKPSWKETATICSTLSIALQHAHDANVIHRDLKPGNIMMDGNNQPCLMDFGLARHESQNITVSSDGLILGTPAYMSPEQALGKSKEADHRMDVYSLGVILYRMLTGEVPFRGELQVLLKQVIQESPTPPKSLDPNIPRDLETIALKAMSKEPAKRYQTAKEFGDDLDRWLNGEPIVARPVSKLEKSVRWVIRHPFQSALVAMSFLVVALGVGTVVRGYYNERLVASLASEENARTQAEQAKFAEQQQREIAEGRLQETIEAKANEQKQRTRAESALQTVQKTMQQLEQSEYKNHVLLAQMALKENDAIQAELELENAKPELRNWEWYHIKSLCRHYLWSFPGSRFAVCPNNKWVWSINPNRKSTQIIDLETGEVQKEFPYLTPITFSPNGRLLATAKQGEKKVQLYDAENLELKFELEVASDFDTILIDDQGTRLAGSKNSLCHVYDLDNKKLLFKHKLENLPEFIPKTGHLIDLGLIGNKNCKVYDRTTGNKLAEFLLPAASSLSPDGEFLFGINKDRKIVKIDLMTGKTVQSFDVQDAESVGHPAVSPDGKFLAIPYQDKIVLTNAKDGSPIREFIVSNSAALQFSADGRHLLAPSKPLGDGQARLFEVNTGTQVRLIRASSNIDKAHFTPDGTRVVVSTRPGKKTEVYDVTSPPDHLFIPQLFRPTLDPSGERLAGVNARTGVGMVYDLETMKLLFTIEEEGEYRRRGFQYLSFAEKANLILAAANSNGGSGVVRVYEPDGKLKRQWRPEDYGASKFFNPVLDPQGQVILVGDDKGNARLFDCESGKLLRTLSDVCPPQKSVAGGVTRDYVWGPQGKKLIFLRSVKNKPKKTVTIYSAETGEFELEFEADTSRLPMLDPQGKFIVTAATENLNVYSAKDGRQLHKIDRPTLGQMPSIDWTKRMIIFSSVDGKLRGFDLEKAEIVYTIPCVSQQGEPGVNEKIDRFAAGQYIVAASMFDSGDGDLRLYTTQSGEQVMRLKGPYQLAQPFFSRDGNRIVAVSRKGTIIWEAPRDEAAHLKRKQKRWKSNQVDYLRQAANELGALKRWNAAVQMAEQLCKASGRSQDRLTLARAYFAADQNELAKSVLESLNTLDSGLNVIEQIEVHCGLKKHDEAQKKALILVQSGDMNRYSLYASICLKKDGKSGYFDACEYLLVKARAMKMTANTFNTLCWTVALGPDGKDDFQKMIQTMKRICSQNPTSHAFRNTLGAVQFRQGELEEAKKTLLESVKLASTKDGHEIDLLFLAMVEHKLGNPQEAKKWRALAKQRESTERYHFETDLQTQLIRAEVDDLLKPK